MTKEELLEDGILADTVSLVPMQLANGKWAWVAMSINGDVRDMKGHDISDMSILSYHQDNKKELIEEN